MKRTVLALAVVLAGVMILVWDARAAVMHVSKAGSDTTGDGSAVMPYATISHAIGLVADGDTIRVAAGTFHEHLWVATSFGSFALEGGYDPATWVRNPTVFHTVVDGDGTGYGALGNMLDFIGMGAVSGFVFQNAGSGIEVNGAEVSDNIVRFNSSVGLSPSGGGGYSAFGNNLVYANRVGGSVFIDNTYGLIEVHSFSNNTMAGNSVGFTTEIIDEPYCVENPEDPYCETLVTSISLSGSIITGNGRDLDLGTSQITPQYISGNATGLDCIFWDPAYPDHNLQPGSPCAGKGFAVSGIFTDSDQDGAPDLWETYWGFNPANPGDAVLDPDGDGLNNRYEYLTWGNPISNTDGDGDGMADDYEQLYDCLDAGTADAGADPDGDGLTNLAEFQTNRGLDPCRADTDNDGFTDGYEAAHACLNPLLRDCNGDPDNDYQTSRYEFQHATDPCFPEDADGDGMPNGWEALYACVNPAVGDSTLDPDADNAPNLQEYQWGTDPCVKNDTDNDGMPDIWEAMHACMEGATADAGLDYDSDTVANLQEYQLGINPCSADSDGDGMPDGYELANSCLDAAVPDGGLDPDGDGVTSLTEYQNGGLFDPCFPDADGDGVSDDYELSGGSDPYNARIVPGVVGIGPEVRLTHDNGSAFDPSLVWTGSEFGVGWIDGRTGKNEVFFTRVTPEGAEAGDDARVSASQYDAGSSSLAWTGSEFGLAWNQWYELTGYFARLSAAGDKIGDDVGIVITFPNGLFLSGPKLVWTGSKFGAAWKQEDIFVNFPFGGTDYHHMLFLQNLSPDGLTVTGAQVEGYDYYDASSDPEVMMGHALAFSGSEFGVTWVGNYAGKRIMFQRMSAAGPKVGSQITIDDPASSNLPLNPDIAWGGSAFGAVWYDYRGGNNGIYFARISSAGTKLGDEKRITDDLSSANYPVLAWSGSEYGVAWRDHRDLNDEIYAVMLLDSGTPIGPARRITFDSATSDGPALAWTGSEFGLAWTDTRDGNSEIYFTRIGLDRDGDGLDPATELALGTSPLDWDSDDDGISDYDEVNLYGTDPADSDTDSDGLSDGAEVYTHLTAPDNWDSDADRLPDGYEVLHGSSLDPLNALDAGGDPDGDTNPTGHEYYNGSDPWTVDPVPQAGYDVGCYFWGKSDGGPFIQPLDIARIQTAYVGGSVDYSAILPSSYDPLDLDRSAFPDPADVALAQSMYVQANRPAGYASSPAALTVTDAPSAAVAVGSTTHVTVSVSAQGPGSVLYSPGFSVVFWVSSGNATLLGGDGSDPSEAPGNRYDISMSAASGAPANIVVLVTGPGPVILNAKIPACGTEPLGRWCAEVPLSSPVVINP